MTWTKVAMNFADIFLRRFLGEKHDPYSSEFRDLYELVVFEDLPERFRNNSEVWQRKKQELLKELEIWCDVKWTRT